MNQDELFKSLATNAFEFLSRGVADFDSSPKYSVIHFCAAAEMFLKARLMREHWALVVTKPDQARIDSFMAGDFSSVSLDEARLRLRNIAGEEISDEAFGCLRNLANHRNKMIHFFHPGMEADERARAQIVAEQCRAWFHLHRLLNRWDEYFQGFQREIQQADFAMKGHRKYLSVKFAALTDELAAEMRSGRIPDTCNSCGFEAAVSDPFDDAISTYRCLVCDHSERQVTISCPGCRGLVVLAGEGFGVCPSCKRAIDPDVVADALGRGLALHLSIKDGDDSQRPANCSVCDCHLTVVRRDSTYFCASCFEFYLYVEACENCGELNSGDMIDSALEGCNFCDGHSDW